MSDGTVRSNEGVRDKWGWRGEEEEGEEEEEEEEKEGEEEEKEKEKERQPISNCQANMSNVIKLHDDAAEKGMQSKTEATRGGKKVIAEEGE